MSLFCYFHIIQTYHLFSKYIVIISFVLFPNLSHYSHPLTPKLRYNYPRKPTLYKSLTRSKRTLLIVLLPHAILLITAPLTISQVSYFFYLFSLFQFYWTFYIQNTRNHYKRTVTLPIPAQGKLEYWTTMKRRRNTSISIFHIQGHYSK